MTTGVTATDLGRLYRGHSEWLRGWLRGYTRCSDKAADIAQDTFCRLVEKRDVCTSRNLRPYLATVARRLLIDDIRRAEVERTFLEAHAAVMNGAAVPCPERVAAAIEELTIVLRELDTLSQRARRAFLLARMDGLPHAEIARMLGVSRSMVKQYVAKGYACCYAAAYGHAQTISSHSGEPDMNVVHEAARWLAHLESGDATAEDRASFDAWRSADVAHATAFDRLNNVRDRLDQTPAVEREAFRRLLSRPSRRTGVPLAALLALAGTGWLAMQLPAFQTYMADERTAIGQTRTVDLADGSHLILATDSAINTQADAAMRRITLLRGEVFAQVAKQENAAFVVQTGDGTATALGTAFTVRKEAGATVVAVAESRVRVCPRHSDETLCLTLQPGQSARIRADGVERLADGAAADIGAWTEGWLPVDNRPVVEVLDELNRWRETPIAFDRRELADLRVSGVFALRDPQKAADNLTQLLPLVLDRSDPSAPVMRRR